MPERRESARDDLEALRIDRAVTPRGRSRRRLVAGAAALGVVLALGGLLYRLAAGRPGEVRIAFAARSGSGEIASGPVLQGSGYVVTGDRYVSLGARVAGRIEAYLVDEGDRVRAGEALVRLDPRPFEARLARAEAALRLARANAELRQKELARLQLLRRRDVSSQAELDIKENQLRVAEAEIQGHEAELAQLRLDLEDAVVRAPTDGIVLEKLKEVGEIATPGGFAGSGDLIRLANLEELRAEVDVNETDLAKVRLGQPAEIVPDAYTDRRYAARVVKLAPKIDRQKGTLEVEVRILEPDAWLRPDMSVRISFLEQPRVAAPGEAFVVAPVDALRSDAAGAFVWVVTEGRLRRQPVETGGRSDAQVIVVSGLAGGERLVVGDDSGLREHQSVRVVEAR